MHLYDLQELPLNTIIISFITVLLSTLYCLVKSRRILPGPYGVPYFGLYPFLQDGTAHLQLAEYGKKYGDVFSFTYTGRLYIHLGSIKAMRDLHVNKSDCFAERFTSFNVLSYMLEDSVTMANGEMWKTHRKFFIQKFREYGLNSLRDSLAGPIYDSIESTINILNENQGKFVNIVQLLTEGCTVTLRRMIFGDNGVTDEDMHPLNEGYAASLLGMTGTNMIVIGPFGRLLFRLSSVARKSLKAHNNVRKILNACIKKIDAAMNEDIPTCIIEEYFKERNELRKMNYPEWKFYSDKALVSSLSQFVGDGIAGVASFISSFLNALIEHPGEQEKIYTEIMDVVGPSRQPTLDDKAKMPNTNAFFNEVIRTSTFVPLFPSLECTKETTYRGYRIPKGAITVHNFWAIHRNPNTFQDPDVFNPSRYIAAPGKPKTELPATFGMGKRACSGETFVMAQTFLFVTTIIKNFKIVSSNDSKNSTADFLLTGKLELHFQRRPET